MLKTNMMIFSIVVLLAGIALAIYGYNLEPKVGEAIANVFDGDFTDKRNILMFVGLGLTVLGGAGLAVSAISRRGSLGNA